MDCKEKRETHLINRVLTILLMVAVAVLLIPAGGIDLSITASAETSGDYTYEIEEGAATITEVNPSISGAATVPSTLGGYPVTRIGTNAFDNCTGLTSVTIPDSVRRMGANAFSGCTGLTSVHITDLAAWCETLFETPSANPLFRAGTLYLNGTLITDLVIPDSVTHIWAYTFYGCTGLASITIPDSVTRIGYEAFYNTGYYNDDANWENGVLYSGKHLIEAEKTLSGEYAVKEGTKTIADLAFENCTELTSVTIPDSVTRIGCEAFSNTGYYNDDANWENGALYSGKHLITAENVNSGEYAVKEGTKTIADLAFENCTELTSVTIPDSVTSIGWGAFYGCTALTDVWYDGSLSDRDRIEIADDNTSATWHYKTDEKDNAGEDSSDTNLEQHESEPNTTGWIVPVVAAVAVATILIITLIVLKKRAANRKQ